jgi:glycine cleavage system T protein
MGSYADAFFGADIAQIDPRVDLLIRLEEERQTRRIILIPSESYAPLAVRQALGSVFTNVYAEGYPPTQMVKDDEELLADLTQQLTYYRRYADRRFYKGADYVHLIEALAQRRAAACFANERVAAQDIYVNVQPLSGAAANLAVYDALMQPGDTLMGMDLYQGGHLTHGSQFNVSGKRYEVVSYGVDRGGRLDYDQIRDLARTHKPKVIVAGYTSYPWKPDLYSFREIADSVGAWLFADVAHTAGMVVAGEYPNPVGIAHVAAFTTHKTLCGPRGACILTTDRALARQIDRAVFPGLQGGPHTNKFAAMCVAFEIARTESFRDLQHRIVENAQALAKGLTDRGLELAYGGTDTHLLMLDLKSVPSPQAAGAGKQILYGEVVARILDLVGIVVNKNTIPGDTATALATGIRLGTPWVSQRGMGPAEMDVLAACIDRVVRNIVPFSYEGRANPLPRGKIDLEVLQEVKQVVDGLASHALSELGGRDSTYPHYSLPPREPARPEPVFATHAAAGADLSGDVVLADLTDMSVIAVSGWRARPFLDALCTADVCALEPGEGAPSFMLDGEGRILDDVAIWRLEPDKRGRDQYLVFADPEDGDYTVSWMREISDGYILFDEQDVWRKVPGPAKVEVLSDGDQDSRMVMIGVCGPLAGQALGQALGEDLFQGVPCRDVGFPVSQVVLRGHKVWISRAGGCSDEPRYHLCGPLEGVRVAWEALVAGGARPAKAPEVRRALRTAEGMPPRWRSRQKGGAEAVPAEAYIERLPHFFNLHKPYFIGQHKLPRPQDGGAKEVFAWAEPAGAALRRTALHQEHLELGAKMISFAGWEMPVWYSSVGEEHQAVRESTGLFDVAHMGTLEIAGPHAIDLIDRVSVNYAWWLQDGESQYSGLLDADGQILDDIIVYRRAWDRFLVVVNAVNQGKDWAWLNAVNENRVVIDRERPWVDVLHRACLRDLQDPASGADRRVDIAVQGPSSLQILLACTQDGSVRDRLSRLARAKFVECSLGGIDVLVSRTGYTGEAVGFELYVHPEDAVTLWRMLLRQGESFGIKPCGLAARDSTRIEAGLPLYGHELAGSLGISQSEAGFGSYVKYHKPFFIGRAPYKATNDESERQVVRFQVPERGSRALRGGEHGEAIVNKRGKVIGVVTSCALVGDRQIGMALVDGRYTEPGTELLIYPSNRKAVTKPPDDLKIGDTIAMPVGATVLPRFPSA